MNQEQFKVQLEGATKFLIDFTREYYFNHFPDEYRFTVTANTRTPDKHLNEIEITVMDEQKRQEGKLLTANQVVELLCMDEMVPVYINLSVYEATDKLTIIDLYTSRRLRNPKEVETRTDKYPPFHPVVPVPPDYLKLRRTESTTSTGKSDLTKNKDQKAYLKK